MIGSPWLALPKRMGVTGLEPSGVTPSGTAFSGEGGAECGALAEDSVSSDPRLMQVIDTWDKLPDGVRSAIVAMVEATTSNDPSA